MLPPPFLVHAPARVYQTIADVDEQRAQQRNDGVEHLNRQHQLKVEVVQALPVELAHAVEGERILDNDRAGENRQEPADDRGDDRQQRVAPRVRIDDDLLAQALGARGADVIHAQRVDHRGTHIAGHAAQRAERHDDDRQRDVVEHIDKFLPAVGVGHTGRFGARYGENAPEYTEQEHENQRNDVNRDAVAQHRDNLYGIVKLFALVHRAVNAQRNGDAQRGDGRENIDKNRILHRGADDLDDVLLVELRETEIALEQSVEFTLHIRNQAHPAGVTHQQRRVQTHFSTQFLVHGFVFGGLEIHFLRLQLRARRVGRNQIIQRVHQKRHDEENKRHISDTL